MVAVGCCLMAWAVRAADCTESGAIEAYFRLPALSDPDTVLSDTFGDEAVVSTLADSWVEPCGYGPPGCAPTCACHRSPCGDCVPVVIRARGGWSYIDDAVGTYSGGGYGLDVAVPNCCGQWGTVGGFLLSHFEEGTQLITSGGAYRQGFDGCSLADRLSAGVLFDQIIDTRLDDVYLSQFRFFLGSAVTDDTGVGVTYTQPVHDDSKNRPAGGGVFTPATFRAGQVVEAFASQRVGATRITATVGHRWDPDRVVAGLFVRRSVNRCTKIFANSTYEDPGIWTALAGLELQFGSGCSRGCSMGCGCCDVADAYMVRGQSGGTSDSPFNDPSLGHNLDYGPETFHVEFGDPFVVVTGIGPDPEEEILQ